jgi:RNA polymerase sigma-70 factor, ECF subfamily
MPVTAPSTSLTLLDCLRQSRRDGGAWERFVRLYTPLLCEWACRQGFRESDIADLTQEVFVKLLTELASYRREADGSFRRWLFTVATNQGHDFRRRKATRGLPQADGLSGVHDGDRAALTDIEETEYTRFVVHRALELVRAEFSEPIWLAFKRHRLEGVPVAEVAAELGIPLSSVYRALSEFLTRLRREIGGFVE